MPSKIPEGVKCEVTPEQAYWPHPVPSVAEGWEYAGFEIPILYDSDAGWMDEHGHIIHKTENMPTMPRIIVRRKPVKHKFVDGLPDICQQFGCRKPASDPIHEQPPAPKPRMMQANPACLKSPVTTHAVEHPEQSSCSMYPCTPVEQPKARRFIVEFPAHPEVEWSCGDIRSIIHRVDVLLIREVKPITRAEADAAWDRAAHKCMTSDAGMGVLLARELGLEVEE